MSIKLIPMKCPCCGASIENVNSPTAVFYADNKKVMEVPVESPDDRAISPAWIEATYDAVINALKAFEPCSVIPLHTTKR